MVRMYIRNSCWAVYKSYTLRRLSCFYLRNSSSLVISMLCLNSFFSLHSTVSSLTNHNIFNMLLFSGFYSKGAPLFYSFVLIYHDLEVTIFPSSGVNANWRICVHDLGCQGKDKTWDKVSYEQKDKIHVCKATKSGICIKYFQINKIPIVAIGWVSLRLTIPGS
jgi:hypothetical protein